MIAVTMPGKMGDALYALPTARLLYGQYGEKIDFYTSSYCEPMRQLIEYQPYINRFIIPAGYIIERMDMGIQPWEMPVEGNYSRVVHLGFKGIPDRALHQYMAHTIGYDLPLAISYDYPSKASPLTQPYVCIAARGETTYKAFFIELIRALNTKGIAVAQIGGNGDYVGDLGWNATGRDMLETLGILHYSSGFIGLMSAMLVLANGINIPRVAIHDGIHWDMRHIVQYYLNHYPINPTIEQTIALLDIA